MNNCPRPTQPSTDEISPSTCNRIKYDIPTAGPAVEVYVGFGDSDLFAVGYCRLNVIDDVVIEVELGKDRGKIRGINGYTSFVFNNH
jgi:hypothetical protein